MSFIYFRKRKLNNKGFTLIELLAVIVILAIVMGVAANAILNVMNDSRKNTLQSSAKSAADAFRTAYAEYEVGKSLNNNTILGISASDLIQTVPTTVNLVSARSSLGLTGNNYDLANSWVKYDPDQGSFTVCLTANQSGSYYVASAVGTLNAASGESTGETTAESSPVGKKLEGMWACSNDINSWSN